jgi:hypothetical protein
MQCNANVPEFQLSYAAAIVAAAGFATTIAGSES